MTLSVHDIRKHFGGVQALDGVTFETEPGAITGLIGPNGSGKTTLFNIISGFYAADTGVVRYGERRLTGLKPYRIVEQGVVRTFQNTRIFPRMSVLENLLAPTHSNTMRHVLRRARRAEVIERADSMLERIGLLAYRDELAAALSYGQSKLVELAIAFMADARIILLDEPSAGINPTLQERINDWIAEENRAGREFLIIEHNMDVVMNLCHRIVVMHHGQMLAQGTPERIQEDQRVLEAYLTD